MEAKHFPRICSLFVFSLVQTLWSHPLSHLSSQTWLWPTKTLILLIYIILNVYLLCVLHCSMLLVPYCFQFVVSTFLFLTRQCVPVRFVCIKYINVILIVSISTLCSLEDCRVPFVMERYMIKDSRKFKYHWNSTSSLHWYKFFRWLTLVQRLTFVKTWTKFGK